MAQRLGGGMWVLLPGHRAGRADWRAHGLTAAQVTHLRGKMASENKPDWQTCSRVRELERSEQLLLACKAEPGGAKSHAMPFLFCTLGRKCSFLPALNK